MAAVRLSPIPQKIKEANVCQCKAPPSKKANEGLSVRCVCHWECRCCWTNVNYASELALQLHPHLPLYCSGMEVEKDWKRNPCDILLARLICGWIGGKSSPPSSDNSDHQHLSTLAASCSRMETAAKSYYFHHHCVLSAPNNPLDPLNPGVTLCRTWPPVQGVSPLRYLPCQKSELCRRIVTRIVTIVTCMSHVARSVP